MKVDVLVAEIGSTTTVVNAFQGLGTDHPVFWGQGQAPTSVLEGDVRVGLKGGGSDGLTGHTGAQKQHCRQEAHNSLRHLHHPDLRNLSEKRETLSDGLQK